MKKKILFINPSLRQGGVEHSLITALKILDPEKYVITLFLYTDMTDLLSEVPDYVKVVLQPDRTRYFRKPFCIWKMTQYKLYKALGREEKAEEARKSMYAYIHRRKVAYPAERLFADVRFDVVVSYSLHIGTEMGTKISAGRRYVLMHSSDPAYHREIIESVLGDYDKVVAVSDSVAEIYRENYRFLADRIMTLPNYVDASRIRELARAGAALPAAGDGTWVLATCGRISHEKGFDLAVSAAALLKEYGVSFRWLFIGDGAEREQVEQLAREKKVVDEILITGFLENPFPYVNACDIYVQPSYEEAQPLAVLEAQILGKPIVSTETVGGKTILENGKKGVLTPLTAAGLADGIYALLTDDGLRASFENLFRPEDGERDKQAYVAGWEALLSG